MTPENTKEALELIERLKNLLTSTPDTVSEAEPQLGIGWYKHRDFNTKVYRKQDYNNYGFVNGEFHDNIACVIPSKWLPMTQDEITAMLKEQCEKRGIKPGATIERPEVWGLVYSSNAKINSDTCNYFSNTDMLEMDGLIVYHQGQFAKVIDEPITIGGKEVLFKGGRAYINKFIYSQFDLNFILSIIDLGGSVIIEGEQLTTQKLQTILNKLKS